MASKQLMQLPTCDLHKDKKAGAMCLKHHELLCISCIVAKAKTDDCNIEDIRDGRVQCIIEHLYAKQTITQLTESRSNQLTKTHNLKEKLLCDVRDLHKKLSSRLDTMVRDCEEFFTKNAIQIETEILRENEFLDDYHAQLERNLKKLNDEEDDNFEQCSDELRAIKKDLEMQSNERMSDPEGSFIPNKDLVQSIEGGQLGITQLFNQKLYDVVGDLDDNDAMSVPMEQKSPAADEMCSGSDQVVERISQNTANEKVYQNTEADKRPKENRSIFDKFKSRGSKIPSKEGNV